MNALVASVIRTYTPIIVGQLAAWLILIHVPIDPSLTVLLTAVVGGLLSGAYYTIVRVLEQQWPWVGALLGLTSSPDAYSKGNPAATTSPAASTPADIPAVAEAPLSLDAAPAGTFPKTAVDAALAAEPLTTPDPVVVAPVYTPPAV